MYIVLCMRILAHNNGINTAIVLTGIVCKQSVLTYPLNLPSVLKPVSSLPSSLKYSCCIISDEASAAAHAEV